MLPCPLLLLFNCAISALAAAYWAAAPVATAQILQLLLLRAPGLSLFAPRWYRIGILYGVVAACFVVLLNVQSVLVLAWAVGTKWLVIGRRTEGTFTWDTSSYCACDFARGWSVGLLTLVRAGQRWQAHLSLMRPMYRGRGLGGVLGPLAGTAYMVWWVPISRCGHVGRAERSARH